MQAKTSSGKKQKETALSYIETIHDKKIRSIARKVRTVIAGSIPEALETLRMGIPCYSIEKKMVASIGE